MAVDGLKPLGQVERYYNMVIRPPLLFAVKRYGLACRKENYRQF